MQITKVENESGALLTTSRNRKDYKRTLWVIIYQQIELSKRNGQIPRKTQLIKEKTENLNSHIDTYIHIDIYCILTYIYTHTCTHNIELKAFSQK